MELDVTRASKQIIIIMAVLASLMIVGGITFYRTFTESLYFAFGVILTTSLNAVKLQMMKRTSANLLKLEEKQAKNFAGFQYLIRYILTIVVFLAAAFAPFIDLFGAVLGIFTLQFSLYIWRFTNKEHFKDDDINNDSNNDSNNES